MHRNILVSTAGSFVYTLLMRNQVCFCLSHFLYWSKRQNNSKSNYWPVDKFLRVNRKLCFLKIWQTGFLYKTRIRQIQSKLKTKKSEYRNRRLNRNSKLNKNNIGQNENMKLRRATSCYHSSFDMIHTLLFIRKYLIFEPCLNLTTRSFLIRKWFIRNYY